MTDLTARFEEQRPHLRAVAYRLLGSLSDADDAVQEAWIRLERTDPDGIDTLGAWLTTVVTRVSLNMLRTRRTRREDPLEARMPEPIVGPAAGLDPEHEALVADSVGLALLVVLETLSPAERVAFVLHDVFAVPFDEIAQMIERTPDAARQLASRARRRVRGSATAPDTGVTAQRVVVDAFFAAGRSGDLAALVAVLDPDVVLRADFGTGTTATVGAEEVAGRAIMFGGGDREARPATVNGAAGAIIVVGGRPVSVMAFTVVGGTIAAIDVLGDAARVEKLDLSAIEP